MRGLILAGLLALGLPAAAVAQAPPGAPVVVYEWNGAAWVTAPPPAGSATAANAPISVTVGTSSTVVYTGGTATHGFVRLVVQLGSAVNVCFNWGGSPAVIGTNCEYLAPGTPILFGALNNSITAIVASGTATVVVTQ